MQKGISALMYAIQKFDEEMVEVLVEGGANLNTANEVRLMYTVPIA